MFNPMQLFQSMISQNNPMMNMFGGYNNFMSQLGSFASEFQSMSNGANPQQIVEGLMNNGKMTQEQFNDFRQKANFLTGQNR